MNKNKKDDFVDDGHTVYNMDGVPRPIWKRQKNENKAALSKEERRAAIKAAFITYGPIFAGVILSFTLALLLILLWLK